MKTLFDELAEEHKALFRTRNLALDFKESVHTENETLMAELDNYIEKYNRRIYDL